LQREVQTGLSGKVALKGEWADMQGAGGGRREEEMQGGERESSFGWEVSGLGRMVGYRGGALFCCSGRKGQ
jgi:hypothetical protein